MNVKIIWLIENQWLKSSIASSWTKISKIIVTSIIYSYSFRLTQQPAKTLMSNHKCHIIINDNSIHLANTIRQIAKAAQN